MENKTIDKLNEIIVDRLQIIKDAKINKETSQKVYEIIFNAFQEIFVEGKLRISNVTMNFVAQMYYDNLTVNGREDIIFDPNIFTERAELENIPTKDLLAMSVLFKGTPFAAPFFLTFKRRQ